MSNVRTHAMELYPGPYRKRLRITYWVLAFLMVSASVGTYFLSDELTLIWRVIVSAAAAIAVPIALWFAVWMGGDS